MAAQKYSLTQEEFRTIYAKVPRLCVDIIIQNQTGVLLTYRVIEPYKDTWHLPGGTVQHKESLEDAVRRVAKTELGITVMVLRFIGYIDYLLENEQHDRSISMVFLCHTDDTQIKLDEQANKFEYFAELPEKTIPSVKRFLQNLI